MFSFLYPFYNLFSLINPIDTISINNKNSFRRIFLINKSSYKIFNNNDIDNVNDLNNVFYSKFFTVDNLVDISFFFDALSINELEIELLYENIKDSYLHHVDDNPFDEEALEELSGIYPFLFHKNFDNMFCLCVDTHHYFLYYDYLLYFIAFFLYLNNFIVLGTLLVVIYPFITGLWPHEGEDDDEEDEIIEMNIEFYDEDDLDSTIVELQETKLIITHYFNFKANNIEYNKKNLINIHGYSAYAYNNYRSNSYWNLINLWRQRYDIIFNRSRFNLSYRFMDSREYLYYYKFFYTKFINDYLILYYYFFFIYNKNENNNIKLQYLKLLYLNKNVNNKYFLNNIYLKKYLFNACTDLSTFDFNKFHITNYKYTIIKNNIISSYNLIPIKPFYNLPFCYIFF